MNQAFIYDAVRTPRARRKGKYSNLHPVDLLTYPLTAISQRNNIDAKNIEDVLVGCVTQTGEQGWCVGRAAVLAAGYPQSVPATTINRLCGSGQQAFNFAATAIQAGQYELAVAAGLEHMTRAPMFSDISGEVSPLLRKHYPDLVQQGMSAEIMADTYKVKREILDQYALASHQKAAKARQSGFFKKSLVPVPYQDENGKTLNMDADDGIRADSSLEALAALKPVFKEGGVITAGNASAIVDGAAAILLGSELAGKKFGLKPKARVISMHAVGSPPKIMLTGPIPASQAALQRAGLGIKDIDVWEINEAFGVVPVVVTNELKIDPSIVNPNGGGISLGHPLGATGVMLLNSALDELERTGKKRALVTMCIGLGMGIATVLERV